MGNSKPSPTLVTGAAGVTAATPPSLQLVGLGHRFAPKAWAVRGVDLTIGKGEWVALIGGSGSGKTTTLRMINRLLEPTEGHVLIDGVDSRELDAIELRRRMGYAIQAIGLFPHYSVADNVAIVPRLLGWEASRVSARVNTLLDAVRLPAETFGARRPAELSGGQAQRVGIARALAAEPEFLLLDEPFGALDPVTRVALQQAVRALHDSLGLTTVLVTHDMSEALSLADRIVVLHEGAMVRVGTPRELLSDPGHPVVEHLMAAPRSAATLLAELSDG